MGRLDGKVAMITGAATGVGEADATLFAKEGAKIVVADIDEIRGRAVVESIQREKGDAFFLKLDVTRELDWQRGMNRVVKEYGKLNILINNAGIVFCASLEDTTLEQWNRVLSVNATGVFLGLKHAIGVMKVNGEPCSIVNRSSVSARISSKDMAAYGASKGAVSSLTRHVAIACAEAEYTIRVNAVLPCEVRTSMAQQEACAFGMTLDAYLEQRREGIPLGRIGEPADIAYIDLYLASDESGMVTGAEFIVDGGVLAQ